MKLAISIWNGRVAPVFDVSEQCLLLDTDCAEVPARCVAFPGWSADDKARFLETSGVGMLVCGAVSNEYENELMRHGVESVSFIAGSIEQVIEAWKTGTLERPDFSMPGCPCPRRRRCRRKSRGGSPV